MPHTLYCWRCRIDIPMLTDDEWALISPHLSNAVQQIKAYREENQCSLAEAHARGFGHKALAVYIEITGFKETNANALFHHRRSIYGPICRVCKKPLRTPLARSCVECGAQKDLD